MTFLRSRQAWHLQFDIFVKLRVLPKCSNSPISCSRNMVLFSRKIAFLAAQRYTSSILRILRKFSAPKEDIPADRQWKFGLNIENGGIIFPGFLMRKWMMIRKQYLYRSNWSSLNTHPTPITNPHPILKHSFLSLQGGWGWGTLTWKEHGCLSYCLINRANCRFWSPFGVDSLWQLTCSTGFKQSPPPPHGCLRAMYIPFLSPPWAVM